MAVTLLEGGVPDQAATLQDVETIQLPIARAADAAFSGLIDHRGIPVDETWEQARRDATAAAFERLAPDVVLIEGYPFARRRFAFELDPLLDMAREKGVPTVCSIRDILVEKKDARKNQRITERARAFARILVHGDEDFAPLRLSFPHADALADRLVYTGYVAMPETQEPQYRAERDAIIVSAGGGAVGAALFETALKARQSGVLMDRPWRFLVGENLPPGVRVALQRNASAISDGAPVIVEPARPDFPSLLASATLSISQAGYNTVMDLARARCPAVLVPFEGAGETEQPLRARLLAERGLVQSVPENTLTPATLSAAVAAAVAAGRPDAYPMRLDGATRTAAELWALVKTRHGDRSA